MVIFLPEISSDLAIQVAALSLEGLLLMHQVETSRIIEERWWSSKERERERKS
jgi:hypothetical protein